MKDMTTETLDLYQKGRISVDSFADIMTMNLRFLLVMRKQASWLIAMSTLTAMVSLVLLYSLVRGLMASGEAAWAALSIPALIMLVGSVYGLRHSLAWRRGCEHRLKNELAREVMGT